MALSRIWSAFIIISILVASIKYFASSDYKSIYNDMIVGKMGDTIQLEKRNILDFSHQTIDSIIKNPNYQENGIHYNKIKENNYVNVYRIQTTDGIINTSKNAVEICIGLVGIITLFMGFMNIAEKAGGINFISRLIQPFFSKLFPEIPKGHPSFGHMILNFSANLLGIDNAATPFGLKAMESLQNLNQDKERASNAQIMFLCLHASGLTLIPVSIIAIRASIKSVTPTDIFLPCIIASFFGTATAIIIVSIKQKINLLQPIILSYIIGISLIIISLVIFLLQLNNNELDYFSKLISNGIILLIFLVIILGALYKRLNIFEAFIEGAKEGFHTCLKIIPYLVGILISISLLRTSGVFDFILDGIKFLINLSHLDNRFVDGLPTALIKPLSGSGARGMMIDSMQKFGPDSFQGRLSSILQGSSDTTFYIIAVYFGSVCVRDTRYTVWIMLISDLVSIVVSILLAYMFFG